MKDDRTEHIKVHTEMDESKKAAQSISNQAKKAYLGWIHMLSPSKRIHDLDEITRSQLKLAKKLYQRILEMEARPSQRSDEILCRSLKQLDAMLERLRKQAVKREDRELSKPPRGIGM